MPEKKIVIVSNPFHARAEYLCKMHLHNQFDNFKSAEIGDIGYIIGSQPHRLFLCIENTHEIRLFLIEKHMFVPEEWSIMYGRKFKIIKTITSDIGYHGLLLLEDEDLIIPQENQLEENNHIKDEIIEKAIDIAINEGMPPKEEIEE